MPKSKKNLERNSVKLPIIKPIPLGTFVRINKGIMAQDDKDQKSKFLPKGSLGFIAEELQVPKRKKTDNRYYIVAFIEFSSDKKEFFKPKSRVYYGEIDQASLINQTELSPIFLEDFLSLMGNHPRTNIFA